MGGILRHEKIVKERTGIWSGMGREKGGELPVAKPVHVC